jgi:cytochrome c peroxidase
MKIRSLFLLACIATGVVHVSQADGLTERDAYQRPATVPSPPSNPLTAEKVALGKVLFFDPRLSRDNSMSCATCHSPAQRWSDGRAIPLGAENIAHPRRSPTVVNSAWLSALMWDGRASTLEAQAVLPITTPHELNYDMGELVKRLKGVEAYRALFRDAFGEETITEQRVAQALASFQRTLVSNEAPFDRWVSGDETAISDSAKRGFDIFTGKAQCAACHKSWRFTDDSFHDIGLKSPDLGRGAFVPPEVTIMQHAFKTPSLRDLPENGPFMHDGSMHSLEEVIRHYEEGGIQRESLSPEMKRFELTAQERADLIAFLKSLDGGDVKVELPVIPE